MQLTIALDDARVDEACVTLKVVTYVAPPPKMIQVHFVFWSSKAFADVETQKLSKLDCDFFQVKEYEGALFSLI